MLAGIPISLIGDPFHLYQILLNLLTNAVKFTENGEITLSVTESERIGNQVRLCFQIRDTGIGMTADQISRLFQPFTQAENSISRKYGGSGLGLTISKQLTMLMGGDLTVESTAGIGSIFTVELPFEILRESELVRQTGIRKLKILIVDDNPKALENLKDILESLHILNFRTASSGEEALRMMETEEWGRTELVFMDVNMPGVSGMVAANSICGSSAGSETRILLMGCEKDRETAENASEIPCVGGMLVKPVSASTVFDCLMERISASDTGALEGKGVKFESPEWEMLRGARILLAEDNEINQQVAMEILESRGIIADVAVNGQVAVEMAEKKRYDAVLMDIQMPVMDGITATRIIREHPELKESVIIAMTADVFSSQVKAYQEAGMNASVFKPIDEKQLFDTLTRFIIQKNGAAEAAKERSAPAEEEAPPEIPPLKGLDVADGLGRMMGNRKLYRKILFQFSEKEKTTANDILEKLDHELPSEALKRIHVLIGVTGNIGAIGLHGLWKLAETEMKSGKMEEARRRIEEAGKLQEEVIDAVERWKVSTMKESQAWIAADPLEDSLNKEQAVQYFEELLAYLELYDAESIHAFEKLKERITPVMERVAVEMDRVGQCMKNFDFDGAKTSLLAVMEKLGIAIQDKTAR